MARKPTYKSWLLPSVRRPDSSLWTPARGEKRARAAKASTHSWRSRRVTPAAPSARAEQPLHRARLSRVEGRRRSLVSGFRAWPLGSETTLRLRPSLPVALLVEKRLVGVERRARTWFVVFNAALSEFPETQLPDFMILFPEPYRQRDPAHYSLSGRWRSHEHFVRLVCVCPCARSSAVQQEHWASNQTVPPPNLRSLFGRCHCSEA